MCDMHRRRRLHNVFCMPGDFFCDGVVTLQSVFLQQVKQAATELGYQPDETFCLKISQLRELFVVRWSVFLLGPAGCGKTAIWRTLMKAQNAAGEKTVSG